MNTSWRSASLAAAAAAVLALTTACGQETPSVGSQVGATAGVGDLGNAGTGTGTGIGASNQQQDAAGASKPAGQLKVSTNAELGKVLTDSAGMTLYRFDADTAEPPKSNCDGDCAKAWPPVPADDAAAGAGIDESLLGEVTRSDGTKQLTIGGWPAYRYAKDTKAGEINGQGVNGKWFALAPDGKKASLTNLPGLSVRRTALGDVVVDRNGMTVYRFSKDQAWPKPVSACTGSCLEKWPAVAPVDENDVKGIVKKGLMSFTRPDGIKQMTIDCWPLYTFSGDKKPGDVNGHGVGGTWFAVAPNGKPIGASKQGQ
ncbi:MULTISPECIES: SCO0930 family lipoprotein [Streptomyces]|uniref:SCO0930 family lipoprotein n=1 Tax=Streptomyces thermogriseus TaxID=75292 RepID=A0ABP4DGD1_9ACTN|nr:MULTISPECIES: SCO0930 family lipoprotein [Streptomyces]MDN5383855.1 SCO0930 family lipoprotein [Streptomyces sp. LB8]